MNSARLGYRLSSHDPQLPSYKALESTVLLAFAPSFYAIPHNPYNCILITPTWQQVFVGKGSIEPTVEKHQEIFDTSVVQGTAVGLRLAPGPYSLEEEVLKRRNTSSLKEHKLLPLPLKHKGEMQLEKVWL